MSVPQQQKDGESKDEALLNCVDLPIFALQEDGSLVQLLEQPGYSNHSDSSIVVGEEQEVRNVEILTISQVEDEDTTMVFDKALQVGIDEIITNCQMEQEVNLRALGEKQEVRNVEILTINQVEDEDNTIVFDEALQVGNNEIIADCQMEEGDNSTALGEDQNARRTRRRQSNSQKWTFVKHQLKREKGEGYLGFRKSESGKWVADVPRKARELKPFCNCKLSLKPTKIKCRLFTEDDRRKLFRHFWKDLNWKQRKIYVFNMVHVEPPKDKRNAKTDKSRRSQTIFFHLKKDGVNIRVCKTMFLNTLCVGEWSVLDWIGKNKLNSKKEQQIHEVNEEDPSDEEPCNSLKSGPTVCLDNKRFSDQKKSLYDFLRSLPKLESHYCRKSTTKLYLEPIWQSKSSLYGFYKTLCVENNKIPLCIKTFTEVFHELNLSVYHPKKDQCDLCCAYKAKNVTEETYKAHITKKESARKEKDEDKNNKDIKHVYTMDLQTVLLCPNLKASAIYYKMKLAVHNFTLYNLKTHDGYCYLWHEAEGGVSSNEFASIICNFVCAESGIKENETLIMYSDGCTAQNRNSNLSNALLNLAQEKNITIVQKYLERGHTQMECDSMHALIERKLRNREIYSPAGYVEVCKFARKNPKPYKVRYLTHTFFKDYSLLRYVPSIRPGIKRGDPNVTDIRALKYTPNCEILYKLNFNEDWKAIEKRVKRIPEESVPNFIKPLFHGPIKIKKDKFTHLQDLKVLIPQDLHLFYDNLPHE